MNDRSLSHIFKMKNRVVVVTGANRGLGFAAAEALAKEGARVVLGCRNEGQGKAAEAKLKEQGLDVCFLKVDQASSSSVGEFADAVIKQYGHVDVLINNAAIQIDEDTTTLRNISEGMLRKTFDANFFGVVWLCRAFANTVAKSDAGRIINYSSGLGQLSVPRMGPYPAYSMSKTAVNAITKNLAEELKDTPIRVVSVDPGWVRTDMGGPNAMLSIEEGIDTTVWLASAPAEEIENGCFYKERRVLDW